MTLAQDESSVQACIPRPTTTTPASPPPTSLPRNFGMIISRAFEMLDVFGPLDALGMLARIHQLNLYLIAETMDPVTVEPVSAAMNSKNSSFVSLAVLLGWKLFTPLKRNLALRGPNSTRRNCKTLLAYHHKTTQFPKILPTHTFATAPTDIEVLMIPGGLWTRSPNLNSTIAYVRATYPKLRYLVSICTGASIAARAGVLDGRRATTNKASWASTIVYGPNVTWVPKARWVVDGNVWTSSGISAGIDATLAFIQDVYGRENATYVADLMEYEWHEDSAWDPYAEKFNVTGS
ncbi:DJ-1/PfpI family protein [Colletotrichum asianum]|uniref:DJ-1/PfpI family protein n=1 Tax=Colletotrichum asianum TaxID=702518 RepID=A0A8H3WUN6_9PEZI|nr:DJ-1/PfpI family protein [Colletotrichum asianum]